MCGKVAVARYPAAEAIALVWVFVGDREPHALTDKLPEELGRPTGGLSPGGVPVHGRSAAKPGNLG